MVGSENNPYSSVEHGVGKKKTETDVMNNVNRPDSLREMDRLPKQA